MHKNYGHLTLYSIPFGQIQIGHRDGKITLLHFVGENENPRSDKASPISDLAHLQVMEYFSGRRTNFDLPLDLQGTVFQKSVWQALCEIPFGERRSYKEIATMVGNPKASRAVGMANNRNPIAIIVPCHRVVGADGSLVGYAGGLDLKKRLLELEQK